MTTYIYHRRRYTDKTDKDTEWKQQKQEEKGKKKNVEKVILSWRT